MWNVLRPGVSLSRWDFIRRMRPLTPSCGWRPPVLCSPPLWNVWSVWILTSVFSLLSFLQSALPSQRNLLRVEKEKQAEGGTVSAGPSHDPPPREDMSLVFPQPRCRRALSNENYRAEGPVPFSARPPFFCRRVAGFLGRGLAVIQCCNNSGTVQVS